MKRINNQKNKAVMKILTMLVCSSLFVTVPFSSVNAAAVGQEALPLTGTSADDGTRQELNVDANGMLGKNSDVGIEVTKSITGEAGKEIKVAFKLKSGDKKNIKLKSVYPVIDSSFPFETSGDAYKVVSAGSNADKQETMSASYKLTARADLETGYHSIRFIGEYTKTDSDGNTGDYYVIKTINIYFDGVDAGDNEPVGGGDDDPGDGYDDGYDDNPGGSGSGDYGGSYDDSDTEVSAPKLIIDGYDTAPKKIMAGETFTLTIHVRNTSKSTPLCNGKFLIGNEAGTFLPTSGSSAVFIDRIDAGKTGDLKIEMKTAADLAQKNYILVVKGDFDDGKGHSFTSSDNLSLPVYQEVKLAVTDVSMSPEMLGIGTEASLMFTINNQGSAGVYNVNASVKGDAVSAEQSYVGNIAGSASAYATLNLTGEQTNMDSGTITVVISYEDAEGNQGEIEQEVDCLVTEDYVPDDFGNYDDEFGEEEESGGISWWIILLIVVLVLVAVIVIIVIVVRKRKKHLAELLEAEDGEDDLENEDF
ncbi:MAG: hypothetical protein NC300_10905 [Bacteroidales bacterium]|nr:hypothetical protein [Clostridium sp.]MCM1204640.1 hypothetical protein [Bacteroidales bacterium]